jgi:hypothetical protein
MHATLVGELKKMKARFNIHDVTIRDPYKQQNQSGRIISRPILSGETLPLRVEYGSYCTSIVNTFYAAWSSMEQSL